MRRLTEQLILVAGKPLKVLAALLVCVCWLGVFAACAPRTVAAKIPTLPPAYYNCIEATPLELINAYYGVIYYYYSLGVSTNGNSELATAQGRYDNHYFVFKSLSVADWMLVGLDESWIYAGSNIKCLLVNPGDMKKFKPGDSIDVVGLNTGITSISIPGLLLKDCYVLPAGAVQLPLEGGPGFTPAPISAIW